ncbi:hypothetical protein ABZW32_28030 [Streptomyces sp. NPDC004667]|uniref:hypothetical protein n=1 Tax=Streptomyces sp. NPDC004667 TaxID=3154285 RepID=UPI0033ACACDF
MISEPELEGEWPAGRSAGEARPDAPPASPPSGGGRVPWRWALGGAVLASMVWAGALVAQERSAEAGPPIRYRHAENLCDEAPLKTLGAIGGSVDGRRPKHGESPAQDWAYCAIGMSGTDGQPAYEHQVVVELHRKRDPGPEFGTGPGLEPGMRPVGGEVEQVPGLGERALMTTVVGWPQLQVLDGGAVFTLTSRWFAMDGPGSAQEPDEDAVKAAMIEDMRQLMARLRR